MPHGEMHTMLACSGYDGFAIIERDRHRLLQQHMFTLRHRGESDLTMRVARCCDVDDVELALRDHLQAIGKDLRVRVQLPRLLPRSLRRYRDGNQPRLGIPRDGLSMKFAPGTETGEGEENGSIFRWHEHF